MSSQMSSFKRSSNDHFQPDESLDPHAQRALRGSLEQIDYIAYLSNREVIEHTLGGVDTGKFQRLAVATASARSQWAALALAIADGGHAPTADQVAALAKARQAFEELAAAYDALRRMVERGYVDYHAPPPRG
jgi:hypothetical protein